ncbi:AI-2E family transporter [Patescibacteria group bacterium]|nr:MAG: AI-2E family transporter [Patescibacteria group bacterium]
MAEHKQEIVVHISTKTYLRALAVGAGVFLLWYLSGVVFILFMSIVLAALILPLAHWAEKRRIPRALAVGAVYIVLIAIVSAVLSQIVPPVVTESSELFKSVSVLMRDWLPSWLDFGKTFLGFSSTQGSLPNIGNTISDAAFGAFSGIRGAIVDVITFVLVLVISFYMVVEEEAIRRMVKSLIPAEHYAILTVALGKAQEKMGLWLRGQLILMLIIGLVMYGGLALLDVKYALVLGLFAGLMEFIPYVGPLLALVPAFIMALSDSPVKAGLVIVLVIIIQQLENHVLVPKVMQKAVGINPLISIFSVMIGARLGGVIGALVAIPIATSAIVFVKDYLALRRGEAPEL